MTTTPSNRSWRARLSLAQIRAATSSGRARVVRVSAAVVYALFALWAGGMLVVSSGSFSVESYIAVVTGGTPFWNYPALIVETPNFVLALPLLATLVMGLVAWGAGLGMTVTAWLVADWLRGSRSVKARGLGSVGLGLSPALVGLVTLGACCTNLAAATAGLALFSQTAGSPLELVGPDVWVLWIVQLVVLYAGLVSQDYLLEVFRSPRKVAELPSTSVPHPSAEGVPSAPPFGSLAVTSVERSRQKT